MQRICKYIVVPLLVQETLTFEITAIYSRFSGLVTGSVRVGSDRQPLRVSLDFSRDTSFLFADPLCPPFVPNCYKFEKSKTYFPSQFDDFLPYVNGYMSGVHTSAEIEIGYGPVWEPTSFTLVTEWVPQSPTFREVAGLISAGRNSEFFKDNIIIIRDGSQNINGVYIESVGWREADLRAHVVIQALTGQEEEKGKWLAPVLLAINGWAAGGVIATVLHFDPSAEDIVIPKSLEAGFMDKLETAGVLAAVVEDRLLVNCSESGQLDPALSFSLRFPYGEVKIFPNVLVMEGSKPEELVEYGSGMEGLVCAVRIRFSSETKNVVIGRPLIRSVESVFLSYRNGLIGLELQPPRSLQPLPSRNAELFVPLYTMPEIVHDELSQNLTLSLAQSSKGSLILDSVAVRRFEHLGQQLSCWVFFRTEPVQEARDIELPGEFKGASIMFNRGGITVRMTPQGTAGEKLRSRLVYSPEAVKVCIAEPQSGSRKMKNRPQVCKLCKKPITEVDLDAKHSLCASRYNPECWSHRMRKSSYEKVGGQKTSGEKPCCIS